MRPEQDVSLLCFASIKTFDSGGLSPKGFAVKEIRKGSIVTGISCHRIR